MFETRRSRSETDVLDDRITSVLPLFHRGRLRRLCGGRTAAYYETNFIRAVVIAKALKHCNAMGEIRPSL